MVYRPGNDAERRALRTLYEGGCDDALDGLPPDPDPLTLLDHVRARNPFPDPDEPLRRGLIGYYLSGRDAVLDPCPF